MKDRTKAPKRTITLEFGSDEFLDAFNVALRMIKEEREAMEARHNRILEVFMQGIKDLNISKFINKNKRYEK